MNFDTTNWRTEKIRTLKEATAKAAELKAAGKKLVTVNGSFDILHAGHLDQLEEAKQQGDVLFVGINSDTSIRNEKGENRPLIPEPARAAMLAALICVDYVVILDEPYADIPHQSFLLAIKPDVHVNGPDFGAVETWVEYSVMQNLGIKGHTITRRNDFSTTDLVNKIKES